MSILPKKTFKKRFALAAKFLLQPLCAVAIAARPWFGPVFVPAVAAGVSVFHAEQIEIFLPIGPFLRQRRVAKTTFDPGGDALLIYARFVHVVQILVAGDGTATKRSVVD